MNNALPEIRAFYRSVGVTSPDLLRAMSRTWITDEEVTRLASEMRSVSHLGQPEVLLEPESALSWWIAFPASKSPSGARVFVEVVLGSVFKVAYLRWTIEEMISGFGDKPIPQRSSLVGFSQQDRNVIEAGLQEVLAKCKVELLGIESLALRIEGFTRCRCCDDVATLENLAFGTSFLAQL
jgi:hypothetical protein